jgi:acetyltransferase-like isoleucine patch superfamily enzyme
MNVLSSLFVTCKGLVRCLRRQREGDAAWNYILDTGAVVHKTATIRNKSGKKEAIRIGPGSHVCGNLTVWNNGGCIEIGANSFVGEYTRIYSVKSIRIGNHVQIAHNCNIFDSNIHSLNHLDRRNEFAQYLHQGLTKLHDLHESDVVIDDDAWIGAAVCVLKGVTIGKGAIVGAGSVVTNNVAPFTIVAGNPARPIASHGTKCQSS